MNVIIDGVEYAPVVKMEEPKKAREFWIYNHPKFKWEVYYTEPGLFHYHVREVLPEENKLKREAMAKIWDNSVYNYTNLTRASDSTYFKDMVKAAGIEE